MMNKEERIAAIVAAGLPEKPSLPRALRALGRSVGLRYAFCGVGDAVAAALLVSLGALLAVAFTGANAVRPIYFWPVFALAPLLYFALLLFTAWKERLADTWQVLQACRFNLRHITAMRAMLVSLCSAVTLPLCTLPLIGLGNYRALLAGAYAAMFGFAALQLLVLLVKESLRWLVAPLWAAAWLLPLLHPDPRQIEAALAQSAFGPLALLALALLALYLAELRYYVLKTNA